MRIKKCTRIIYSINFTLFYTRAVIYLQNRLRVLPGAMERCKECDGSLINDYHSCELVCTSCGLVNVQQTLCYEVPNEDTTTPEAASCVDWGNVVPKEIQEETKAQWTKLKLKDTAHMLAVANICAAENGITIQNNGIANVTPRMLKVATNKMKKVCSPSTRSLQDRLFQILKQNNWKWTVDETLLNRIQMIDHVSESIKVALVLHYSGAAIPEAAKAAGVSTSGVRRVVNML